MSVGIGSRLSRIGVAGLLLVATALCFSGSAAGQESLKDLQARMDSIQGQLDATTIKIERLRDQNDHIRGEMAVLEGRMQKLEDEKSALMSDAVARADALYRGGTIGMAEALFTSENFSELSTRAELISQVSAQDSGVFVRLSRTEAELDVLGQSLAKREAELRRVTTAMERENKRLQEQFHSVSAEYQRLRRKLAAAQTTEPSGGGGGSAPIKINVSGNMTCPVAGPVSFVDSWGAPRSGHTHQGVDMMGDYGTPLVAIVSGTVSYAAYDGSGGNMIWIDGTDGNSYYYMHNQENFVGQGARVQVGQQIATLGDTGNAAGTPHLHFEFHPGGGSAVNPYPLVSSLC